MKKLNQIKESNIKLGSNDFSNMFNVYQTDSSSDIFSFNINRTLNLNNLPNPNKDSIKYPFKTYKVELNDTWPLISYKLYDTISLWWLVCKCNNIVNATINPKPDDTILVLESDFVNTILSEIQGFK